jgi:drug/metabolite transporter (DMT)-like permease
MNIQFGGALLVSLAAVLWGFDGIVLTPNLFKLDVAYVVFMLHLLPFLGMTLLFGREEIKNIISLPKSDLIYYFLIAVFGGSLGTIAIVKALFLVNFQHLTVVTLLQKLQPVFAIILARIILGEQLKKSFIFWGIVALIGGYFLTFEFTLPSLEGGANLLQACGYAILAAFSFGSSTVFGKRILNNSSFRTAVYARYLFTTLVMSIFVIFGNKLVWIGKTTPFQWLIFIIIGLTSGSGAIYIYYKGLRSIKANIATICELCFPLSSIIFDFIFNGHLLSPIQVASAGMMIFAILKITKKQMN